MKPKQITDDLDKLLEVLPQAVKEDLDKEEAEKLKQILEEAGGTVEIK